jgi:hypothetical protein
MTEAEKSFPALSRLEVGLLLFSMVLLFLVGLGPVWEHPWDVDGSIGYSYLPIPFLVLAMLAWKRRLKFMPWLLHTLEVTFAKFIITATILVAIWAKSGTPPAVARLKTEPVSAQAAAEPFTPTPTAIDPASTGVVDGQVVAADGSPVAGALVFVSEGLELFVFAAPDEPLVVQNDGRGFHPRIAAAQVGQSVVVRSGDRVLHTSAVSKRSSRWLMNLPMVVGKGQSTVFRQPMGLVTLECTVHGNKEPEGHLAILSHPFHRVTGPDGRFRWEGIPAGKLALTVLTPSFEEQRSEVTVSAGQTAPVTMTLAR